MTGGASAACSSVAHGQPCARWDPLLGYLKGAGLREQHLRAVQDLLIEISFRDIDIIISHIDGEKRDLTISCYLTAGGLKKRLAGEWCILASSLQLVIGSTYLRDVDVIAEYLSSTDRVVTAVVGASSSFQVRDEFTERNDDIRVKLDIVRAYMDDDQHQELMMLWEQSCVWAQYSCEAAVSSLARLSNGFRIPVGDVAARDLMKDARKVIRSVIVKRVEGWQVANTLRSVKMTDVFRRLALDAGCPDTTAFQLLNTARYLSAEGHEQ